MGSMHFSTNSGRSSSSRSRSQSARISQDGVHEPGVAQRARGGVSGEPRAVDLDLRRVPRRCRDQRDHPRASRRRRQDRARTPRDPGQHVHDGRLEHARPELLRHVRRKPLPRLGAEHESASRSRRPCALRELRLRVDPRASAPLRPRLAGVLVADRPHRLLDRGPRGELPRASRPGVPRHVTADALPRARRDVAGRGLGPALRHDLVPARRVQHSAVARERRARPGVVERRDALPDHAGRHRNGAGVPPLRAERRCLGLRSPRVQCRRQAHPHAHERRRRLHRDRVHASHRPLQEGARAGSRRKRTKRRPSAGLVSMRRR